MDRIFKLVRILIKQGVAPAEAFSYSRTFLASTNLSQPNFMALIGTMEKDSKWSSKQKNAAIKQTGKQGDRMITIGTERGKKYIVKTDLPPQFIKPILMETFLKWMKFAQGASSLGGKRLKHPSGQYAASLTVDTSSDNQFTIYSSSPHADVLETGRKPYLLEPPGWEDGKIIPIGKNSLIDSPRTPLTASNIKSSRGAIYPSATLKNRANSISRKAYMTRYAKGKFRTYDEANPWEIDSVRPMPVYSPAFHLYQKLTKSLRAAEKAF